MVCGQDHTAIMEQIDPVNMTITTCIQCPIIVRTDPSNTPLDKAFNFRWCPLKLASCYGYQPEDVKEAWSKLIQTRYARILVPRQTLDRLLEKALRSCELERIKCNFKRTLTTNEEEECMEI
jgi:hypothetical protein